MYVDKAETTDEESRQVKFLYPQWSDHIGENVEVGRKFLYGTSSTKSASHIRHKTSIYKCYEICNFLRITLDELIKIAKKFENQNVD